MTENSKTEEMMKKLWDDYSEYVKKFCTYKLSSSPWLIDDCVQEVFLDLTATVKEGKEIKNYKAWLTTVANNKCKDIYSHLKKEKDSVVPLTYEMSQTIADTKDEFSFDKVMSDDELLLTKDAFIASLSEIEKDLFYQRFVLKKKSEELALIYGTTAGNVRKRVFKLRQKAREFVKRYLKEQNAQK